MPTYTFKCNVCDFLVIRSYPVSHYLKIKKDKIKCEKCDDGVLSQQVLLVNSSIEKSQDILAMDSKEEVRKIVDKVRSGDLRAIEDIYGDRPNPYKKEH